MKRIAVISDTHNQLRPKGIQTITVCDAIIHGNDITNQQNFRSACHSMLFVAASVEKTIIPVKH